MMTKIPGGSVFVYITGLLNVQCVVVPNLILFQSTAILSSRFAIKRLWQYNFTTCKLPTVSTMKVFSSAANTPIPVHTIIPSPPATVTEALGDTVRLATKSEVIHGVQFNLSTIDHSHRPVLACKLLVGRNGIKYATVRWDGGRYRSQPELYEVSYWTDENEGFMWSNLTLLRPGEACSLCVCVCVCQSIKISVGVVE